MTLFTSFPALFLILLGKLPCSGTVAPTMPVSTAGWL
jgi:hypothetical protein